MIDGASSAAAYAADFTVTTSSGFCMLSDARSITAATSAALQPMTSSPPTWMIESEIESASLIIGLIMASVAVGGECALRPVPCMPEEVRKVGRGDKGVQNAAVLPMTRYTWAIRSPTAIFPEVWHW